MPSSSFWDTPVATIEKALHIRKQIEALKTSLNNILPRGGGGDSPFPFLKTEGKTPHLPALGKTDGRKGKRSAATIAKMKAAQKARWAKKGGESTPAADPVVKSPKKKRTMSPEARAKIAVAQRARWAKAKV